VTVVGLLGGGQLGRMLALAAAPLGMKLVVVEPGQDPPAALAAEVLAAPYGDPVALAELARRCAVVTVELEGVPVDALRWLADRVEVRPGADAVSATQDRQAEKEALARAGVPTAPWAPGRVAFAGGTIVKARRGGYDGRGQVVIPPGGDLSASERLGDEVISEEVVAFDRELSVVAARAVDGTTACYPLVENHHAEGILRRTLAPAPDLTPGLQVQAEDLAGRLLDALGYVGVIAIELFQVGGQLLANEVAPRVHNSGHWTIEGAVTSQFEQHLRAVTGLPLGSPESRGVSAMVNLIGSVPSAAVVLGVPGAHLHLYGKPPRPARKLGHVTVVADDADELAARLAQLDGALAG
jgi:5-(carboxyamino)imidazole ribonucleotide synthase